MVRQTRTASLSRCSRRNNSISEESGPFTAPASTWPATRSHELFIPFVTACSGTCGPNPVRLSGQVAREMSEVMVTAYCGPSRHAATFLSENSASCGLTPSNADSQLVAVCERMRSSRPTCDHASSAHRQPAERPVSRRRGLPLRRRQNLRTSNDRRPRIRTGLRRTRLARDVSTKENLMRC
jgi:hypothetical protein